MTFEERVNNEYFDWLYKQIDGNRFSSVRSYHALLRHLHNIEFTWFIPHDDNRASDGIQLRRRYALGKGDMSLPDYLRGPCSVFEMMVALAIRAETIMDDDGIGDRTGQWFWTMIHNLGLTPMTDGEFDRDRVDAIIARMLNREYEPDGSGGLFTVRNCVYDMRKIEIWCQLSWHLGSFVESGM
jgi:hypothetical protein